MRLVKGLLLATLAQAATPLFHGSFEKPDHGWTVIRGSGSPDTAVLRGSNRSLRVEPGSSPDAYVRSAPVPLTIGKRYELNGWVRTEGVTVRDFDRSPNCTPNFEKVRNSPAAIRSELTLEERVHTCGRVRHRDPS
jgi:hypothetical protein